MEIRIDSSTQFDLLPLVSFLKEKESPFFAVLTNVYSQVKNILNSRITAIFPKYTLHDCGHSFRIINYMSQIVNNYKDLSDLEITLLILSSLLHDIGMGVSEDDLALIKKDHFEFSKFKYSTMLRLMKGDEVAATQEYIRRIHAELSGRYIRDNLKSNLMASNMPHLDYSEDLALICESHTKEFDWIKSHLSVHEVRGSYAFNAQYISAVLRLADILDIDGNRTPYKLYKLIAPSGKSDEEWRQHFVIFNDDKIVLDRKTELRQIVFYGKSKNADIHRKILSYIDGVEAELTNTIALTTSMKNQYDLPFSAKPIVNIQPEGYTFSGYKMTLKFSAISSLLMGEKIYGTQSLGLRELIQNSFDACRTRQESEKRSVGEESYLPRIRIILDQKGDKVIVKDNGAGMSIDIIKNHFLNIGVSYYQSFDFLLMDLSYKPIGNYGIGFLSCFMMSDVVTVKTRHHQSKYQYLIQFEKGNEWTSLTEMEDISFFGTEVILSYQQFVDVFRREKVKINDFLTRFFLTDGVDFKLIDNADPEIEIKNELWAILPLEKGHRKITLSTYLQDIEGYAIVKKKSPFFRSLEEIDFDGDVYIYQPATNGDAEAGHEYQEAELFDVEDLEAIQIDEYIFESQLRYVSIPIIRSSDIDDINNGLKFTGGGISDVIDKMKDELRWISILIPKSFVDEIAEEELDDYSEILDGISFDWLKRVEHALDQPTYRYVKTVDLFEGIKNELYLPFHVNKDEPWWYRASFKPEGNLYIRNVLIKDFHFSIPIAASIIDVVSVVINIKSRKIVPDVARNNIDPKNKDTINYVVGKAVYLGLIDSLEYTGEEQKALQDFVKSFYEVKSEFEV